MAIGPDKLIQLTDAVLSAINDFELQVITHVVTGDHLYAAYVSDNQPLMRQIRELLVQLDKDGSLPRFLAEIIKRKPERPDLRVTFIALVPAAAIADPEGGPALDLQRHGKHDDTATPLAAAPGLQRNVRPHLNMLEIRGWLEGLQSVERRVCRIEIGRNGIGTGFLVGPAAVMTCWHVIRKLIAANDWSKVGCRFDHVVLLDDSAQDGELIPLGDKGLVAFSPASGAELTPLPDQPPPTPDELDYALLHLSQPAGTERGWVELPKAVPELAAGTPLIIAQHPLAAPMKLAIDTDAVIGRVHSGLRLRYHTNTEAGSSGSPCFNMDWQLVALHHLGDPKEGPPVFNQGIPAELIRADIGAKGLSAHLAATG